MRVDGASRVVGRESRFCNFVYTMCWTSTARLSLCTVRKEALCAKAGLKELEEMMKIVTKVVSCICVHAFKKKERISEFAE